MTLNPNIFRDLCAELVQAWDDSDELVGYEDFGRAASYLVDRARAALAEPEPEGPTPSDEELMALAVAVFEDQFATDKEYARAVLARWGGAAPQPEVEHD